MSTSVESPRAASVVFRRVDRDEYMGVALRDGRLIAVPLALYPSLLGAKPSHRANWRLIARGHGIHWPDLDLDLSTDGLIAARPEVTSVARRANRVSGRVLSAFLRSRPSDTRRRKAS